MKDLGDQTTVREDVSDTQAGKSPLLLRRVQFVADSAHESTELSPRPLRVGRQAGPGGLTVPDVKMSRAHFTILPDPSTATYWVEDAGSRNGTYLNGRRLTRATLRPHDVIRAGDSLFVCHPPESEGELARQARAARSKVPLLITGETGTGKDLLACRLHELSGRRPMVPVNCGALPRELIASELFGHTRGSFSGATASRPGLFAAAHGGTLFLDEICELPLELQPALLRALEGGRVRPIGAEQELTVDLRVIAATNVDAAAAVCAGRLRADLYARIAGVAFELKPLRHRRESLLQIAAEIAGEGGFAPNFGVDALEALLIWSWPYNVRELKTLILALKRSDPSTRVTLEDLQEIRPQLAQRFAQCRAPDSGLLAVDQASPLEATAAPVALRQAIGLRDAEDLKRLEAALLDHRGHLTKAAEAAEISRQRAHRLLQRFPSHDPRRRGR